MFHELIKPVVHYVIKNGSRSDLELLQKNMPSLPGYEYSYTISGLEIVVRTAVVNGIEKFTEAFVR